MNKVKITKESALNRIKAAMAHKKEIKASIENEYASNGKSVNVVFL